MPANHLTQLILKKLLLFSKPYAKPLLLLRYGSFGYNEIYSCAYLMVAHFGFMGQQKSFGPTVVSIIIAVQ